MNALAPVEEKQKRQLIDVVDPIPVLDTSRFEHMQRIASVMAQSTLIPESLYKEKDNELPLPQIISNCFLVVNQAVRWGLDPFAVAQSVAVVRGKLCYEGKLVAAVLDAKLGVRLHHHFTGDPTKPEYRIYTADRQFDAEMVALLKPGVSIPGVRIADGSVSDFSTGDKGAWGSIKNYRRMLTYRNSRDWARFFEPAVLLGVYTPDELIELAEGARAARAREVEGPTVMQRLQARQDAPQQREGFDQSFVTRETAALTGVPAGEQDADTIPQSSVPSADDGGVAGTTHETFPGDAAPVSAGDEPAQEEAGTPAAVTSEQAGPASSVTDMRVKNLMRECMEKFLATATDHRVPEAKQRQDNLIFCKNVWKEELRDKPEFVKACADRANQVIKGELQASDARAYLERLV